MDRAYEKDNYCYDCACGETNDRDWRKCYFDSKLKEKICNCKPNFSQLEGVCESCYCGPQSTGCNFTNGGMNCYCKEGFVPKNEYCQAACNEKNPCKYGGKCVDGFCQCKNGTAGTFCQIIVDCSNNEICGRDENALCLYDEEREEAFCRCNGTGLIFDENKKKCVECDCAEKGVCSLEEGKKECSCIPTYGSIGGKCTECNCGDKTRSCYYLGGRNRCLCEKGFADKDGKCTECSCGHGVCSFKNGGKQCLCYNDYSEKDGQCVACGCGENALGCTFGKDKTTCKCKTGFIQHESKCKACDCGKKGTCSFDKDGREVCDCDSGYAVKNGKCVEECSENCDNGGKCEEENDSHFCKCSKGTSGDLCETIDACETMFKDCKSDLGTCKYNETRQAAYCECDENSTYDAKLKRCRKTCSKDVPCENGGKCVNSKCQCQEGTSGDLCSTVDGCKAIQDKCSKGYGICLYAPNKPGKAECGCKEEGFMFSEEKQGCRAIWCLENSCAATANCYFETSTETAYCECRDKTNYYNNTGKSCNAVDSCLFSSNCGKFEVCENGKCICPRYHVQTNDGCMPKLCDLHLCYNYKGAKCVETDIVGTVDCVCDGGMYYDGSQCTGGYCFLPDEWGNCYDGCPDGMEKTNTGCKAKDESKACEKDCGKYGFCLKEGKEEVCKCIPKFTKMASGKCILNATAVCASGKLTSDSSRCECTGILKYAANNITCEKKTCSDVDVQEECDRVGASVCKNNWNKPGMEPGSGYECVCPPGYSKNAKGICTDKCKLENHASECAARGQICLLDDLHNANCKCPPTTAWNKTTQRCDILNENTFMIQSLPVIKKNYLKKDGSVDTVRLNADIVNAMKTVYQTKILDYAYLYKFTETENVLNCSVLVQLKDQTKWDIHRYQFYKGLDLGCKNCSVRLLPPVVMDKELYSRMSLEKLNFCSDHLKNALCGEGSKCSDRKCSCQAGYRTVYTSVQATNDFTILKCEDINECLEGIDSCTKNTSCVNTQGDYYCECKPGYKKFSDTYPYKNAHDKEACVDFCSPSPCVKGSCSTKEKGFDCSCELGYTGSLCDRGDEYLKKANNNSKIIGGVLGALLGVTILAFAFYYLKKRNQGSEADFIPERPADRSEMAERRPPRGISNRSYE
ncbi:neurogenic locus notch homolog protein 1-like isoform X1 [Uloborus diversus]|uniref:neurogenic locus notch homolog protein 1-like isoform X1 n=1 Tax=Uloborus diversus TaxID=327109 RepID=UPI00240A3704|nr:neurogenic locus notch homolog protein 1-like isoform X1 [Uloborus diversus]